MQVNYARVTSNVAVVYLLPVGLFCTPVQDVQAAARRLEDPTCDPEFVSMQRQPCYAETLDTLAAGEVRYMWQMENVGAAAADVQSADWVNLPSVMSRCLDREYAKYLMHIDGPSPRDLSSFGISVNLEVEVSWTLLAERTYTDQHGLRQLRKPSKAILVVTFDRRSVAGW